MSKKISFLHNEKSKYYLFHNDNRLTNDLKRIIIKKNYINKLINTFENDNISSYYFIHGEKGLNSFLFKRRFDVVFTNSDNEVIYKEEKFELNKISNYYKELKYIYLLPLTTIKKKNIQLGSEVKHSQFK